MTITPAAMPARSKTDLRAALKWHARNAAARGDSSAAIRWGALCDALSRADEYSSGPWILGLIPETDGADRDGEYWAALEAVHALMGWGPAWVAEDE